ncbi:DUF2382 domain-containing protein [Roseomonas sp. BN140053]|uniref:DUF2382 domain-containing protein n=1 Tax=Roseomonas sp. BN140053 TaxID=3391898 RepID=UPI0039E9DD09
MPDTDPAEAILPVAEEVLHVSKRQVETGRVRVSLTTEAVEELVRDTLRRRRVEVERVAVNRRVEQPPQVREEDGVLVIPVVEEVLVVEKRLMLKEEIRLRFLDTQEAVELPQTRRVQHAAVERVGPTPDEPAEAPSPAP